MKKRINTMAGVSFCLTFLLVLLTSASTSLAADKRAEREYLRHLNKKPLNAVPPAKLAGSEKVFGAPITQETVQSLGFDQIPSASPGTQVGTTTFDNQHNGRMGRQVDWRGTQMVHFLWTKKTNTILGGSRGTGYEVWDATQSPGIFVHAGASPGGGCDVHPQYGGYVTLDIAPDGRAIVANNYDQGETPPLQATVWYDFSPASCFFGPGYRLPDSVTQYIYDNQGEYQYLWPSMEFQIYGADTITHIFAMQAKGNEQLGRNIIYFRRLGLPPVVYRAN